MGTTVVTVSSRCSCFFLQTGNGRIWWERSFALGTLTQGRRSAAILKRLAQILKKAFPNCEILFRAAAGYALPEVYETCEELAVSYLISLPKNDRLLTMVAPLIKEADRECERTKEKVRLFGELFYAAGTWTKERRGVVKAEVTERGRNPRFVVTNLKGDPGALYERYCDRGDCENRIEELKLDLLSGRTSCHRFVANCFRLLMHALGFVLLTEVARMLSKTPLERASLGQIRLKLLKLAAVVETSTRRVLVRFARGHPHAELMRALLT